MAAKVRKINELDSKMYVCVCVKETKKMDLTNKMLNFATENRKKINNPAKMKKTLTLMVAALLCCATAFAKDLKVLVLKTTPEVLNVESQTKVKNQLRLTAGVKKVEADFAAKQVMVTYDADKTDQKKILAGMKKIGYEATVVSDGMPVEKTSKKVPVDATSGASQQKK